MPKLLSYWVLWYNIHEPVCLAVGTGGNMRQPDKLTAYYFGVALQTDTLCLDNQMQRLLYYASRNGNVHLPRKVVSADE